MSFAFARGFWALGAVVGELRLFGGMVALSFAPSAIPAAVLSWGPCRRFESRRCGLDQLCCGRTLTPRRAASSSCKAALHLRLQENPML